MKRYTLFNTYQWYLHILPSTHL